MGLSVNLAVFLCFYYLRLYFSRSVSMMSAKGKPKRLKAAWTKILHRHQGRELECNTIKVEIMISDYIDYFLTERKKNEKTSKAVQRLTC